SLPPGFGPLAVLPDKPDYRTNRTCDQHNPNSSRSYHGRFVALDKFLEPIKTGRCGSHYGLMRQVAENICPQPRGRIVPTSSLFFEALHHDPVQVPSHGMD